MQQQQGQEKLKRFVLVATQGCGRQICTQDFCKSNPNYKLEPQVLQQKVIELSKNLSILQQLEICEIIPKHMTFEEIQKILQNCHEQKNLDKWKQLINDLFCHEDSILQQFSIEQLQNQVDSNKIELENSNISSKIEEEQVEEQKNQSENTIQEANQNKVDIAGRKLKNTILDVEKIQKVYDLILKSDSDDDKTIKNQNKELFETQLLNYLVKVKENYLKTFYKQKDGVYLNILIFIMLYPDLLDKTNQDLNQYFFSQFQCLNKEELELLSFWAESVFDKKLFLQIVQNLQSQLVIQFYNEEQMGQEVYQQMSNICKVLKLFFEANRNQHIIQSSEFVSEFLKENTDYINPKQEYIDHLKHQKYLQQGGTEDHFSFVDYTFLMDVNLKQQFLEIENDVEQQISQQRGIQDMLRNGDIFNNPLQFQLSIKIRRDHILDDTIKQITQERNWKLKLQITFEGEQGIDEGGVQKEFFVLLIKELFNLNFGMFVQKNDNRFHWFNGDFDDMPIYFELVGIILGLAIYNNVLLDIKFPRVVYKKLLNRPLSIEDIKEFDPKIYEGLKHIQDYEQDDLEDSLISFEIKYESIYGENTHLLKENGADIIVNQQNKLEYIQLYLDWYLNDHISKQFKSFQKGFDKVTKSSKFLQKLEPEELQQIIVGCEILDFNGLREKCKYADGFTPQSQTIKDFWDLLLNEFTLEQQKRFLFFMSGSDRAPVQGLKFIKMIIVRQAGDSDKLPSSSTCFNHFFLPEYATKVKLKQKLLLAMENAEGFGLL